MRGCGMTGLYIMERLSRWCAKVGPLRWGMAVPKY